MYHINRRPNGRGLRYRGLGHCSVCYRGVRKVSDVPPRKRPPPDLKPLGAVFRRFRESRHVSQEAFAHEHEFDRSVIGATERGERNIAFGTIRELARQRRDRDAHAREPVIESRDRQLVACTGRLIPLFCRDLDSRRQQLVTLPSGVTPLLNVAEAARYLGLSVGHVQARADIPRVNVAAPESHKPAWRYRVVDLERFAELRLVNPYRTHVDQERDSRPPRSGVEKW